MTLVGLLPWFTLLLVAAALRPGPGRVAPGRLALVRAMLACGAGSVVLVEILSSQRRVETESIYDAWLVALAVAAAAAAARVWWTRATFGAFGRHLRYAASRAGWAGWTLIGMLTALVAGELVVSLASPPNNYDSMVYHLPRVEHWVQQHSVDAFATAIYRQQALGPGAEYLLLHLRLLTGDDGMHNLVQWSAGVGCLLAISRIAAQLGAGPIGQILAAFAFGCTPMVVLQATSTQTDLTVACWVVCATTVALDGTRARARLGDALLIGCGLGLTSVTKATGLLVLAPILVWWGLAQLGQVWDRTRVRAPARTTTAEVGTDGARADAVAGTDAARVTEAVASAAGGFDGARRALVVDGATGGTAEPVMRPAETSAASTAEPVPVPSAAGKGPVLAAVRRRWSRPAVTLAVRPGEERPSASDVDLGRSAMDGADAVGRENGRVPAADSRPLPRRAWPVVRELGFAAALVAVVMGAGLAVTGPFLAQNQAQWGHPLGPPWLRESTGMARHDPAAVTLNAARVAAEAAGGPWQGWNETMERWVDDLGRWVGVSPDDPDITFIDAPFRIVALMDEDFAPFPAQFALSVIAVGAALFGRRWTPRWYALAVLAAATTFVTLLAWQPWMNRLLVPMCALAAPLVGVMLGALVGVRWWWLRAAFAVPVTAMTLALLYVGGYALVYGLPRPLIGDYPVLSTDRETLRYARVGWRMQPFETAAERIRGSGARRVGLIETNNEWEYPWWVLLRPEGKGPEIVSLRSMLPHRPPASAADVDAVICVNRFRTCQQEVPRGWRLTRDAGITIAFRPTLGAAPRN